MTYTTPSRLVLHSSGSSSSGSSGSSGGNDSWLNATNTPTNGYSKQLQFDCIAQVRRK